MVSMLLESWFGMSMADAMCGGLEKLSADNTARVEAAMARLEQGEPVQYVLGEACFCGHRFSVCPGVLIPRPETEQLCQIVSERIARCSSPSVLDICTGSGCIAVSLALGTPRSTVEAWDISPDALRVAADNAARLGAAVRVLCQDALCPPHHHCRWDAVVSNPPYIPSDQLAHLDKQVQHEPAIALDGGADGLKFYRIISCLWKEVLKEGGLLAFEIGFEQGEAVSELLRQSGYGEVKVIKDLGGNDRVVTGIKL